MKTVSLFFATLALALTGMTANAASVTKCGTDVCFTYDDSTLFGDANVIGNNIFFLPTTFLAESLDGEGAVSAFATLNVEVEAITPGFNMNQFFLQESGDYFLQGEGASVSAGGMFAVTSLTQTCGGFFPCREQEIFNATGMTTVGSFDDWSISAAIDLTNNAAWSGDTKVTMTLENRLSATTLNTGEQAFIQKKFAGVGITVVPVPAAVWLLGSALGGLAFVARRRKRLAV